MVFGLRRDYTVRDVVLYIVDRFKGIRGLKKLMKLVFLVEFESCGFHCIRRYLVRGKPATRAKFIIWEFGPFSRDVYEVLDETSLFEVADPEPPVLIVLTRRGKKEAKEAASRLPEKLRKRIDDVIARYGKLDGGELARHVYRLLDLDEVVKEEYMGVDVDRYLEDRSFEVKLVDLAKS